MAAKDDLGRRGEQVAAEHLEERGWRILDRNWRSPLGGELDIVAWDGRELVAVEVKTRTSETYGHPFEAVDARKRGRVWRLGLQWCAAHPGIASGKSLRVDAIALTGDAPFRIEHLRDLR